MEEAIQNQLTLIERQATDLADKYTESFEIQTADQYDMVALILARVDEQIKEIDASRKEATRPLDESKKTILNWFKPPLERLQKVKDTLKTALSRYQTLHDAVGRAVEERRIWKAKVVNPDAVPRKYCLPDLERLNDLARQTRGTLKVKGVEFFEDVIIATKGR